jgi:hypothetical protein
VLIGLTALTGCGESAELKPRTGKQLPIAPYGRGDRPSPSKLLEPNPQASPVRNVELRQKSENRQDDPFDLPPEG